MTNHLPGRGSAWSSIFAFAVLLLNSFCALDARAHICGPQSITVTVGETVTYRITADVDEVKPSQYDLSINSDPTVSGATPGPNSTLGTGDAFSSTGYGEWLITALKPGTNTYVFEWSYAPNHASGSCTVTVIVQAKPVAVSSANQPHSSTAKDPIDTYTGEYLLEEPPDINLGGPLPLFFQRYYASLLVQDNVVHSPLGPNWMSNFDLRLIRAGASAKVIFLHGRQIQFALAAAKWVLTNSLETRFQLQQTKTAYIFADPDAQHFYSFDLSGKLTKIQDINGNALTLTYNSANTLSTVTDGLGRRLTFTLGDFQNVLAVSDGTRTVRFGYNYDYIDGGYLVGAVTNAIGQVIQYQYGGFNAQMTARVLPGGAVPEAQTYDNTGRVVSQTDGNGNHAFFTYQPGMTAMTDPAGNTSTHVHDTNGDLIAITNEMGGVLTYSYDSFGRPTQSTDELGQNTLYQYDSASGMLSAITDVDGLTDGFSYVPLQLSGFSFYDLAKHTFKDGTAESYTYSKAGNVATYVDGAARKWSFAWTPRGEPLSITLPNGAAVKFGATANGLIGSTTMPGNASVVNRFDAVSRLVEVTWPDGTHRTMGYSAQNLLTNLVDEAGASQAFTQTNGELATLRDGLRHTSLFSYTGTQRLSKITGPLGEINQYSYDALDRFDTVTDANGNTNQFLYDALGDPVGVVDGEGYLWQQVFDADGRVTALIDPIGEMTHYQLDSLGRLTKLTSPAGGVVSYSYDALGRLLTIQNPVGNTITNTYNADGELISRSRPGGITATYQRNSLGDVTNIIDPNGHSWTFLRDAAGRLAGTVDPLGHRTTWTLDKRGRLMKETLPLGTLSVTWDGRSLVDQLSYSDKTVLQFHYDARGMPTNGTGFSFAYNASAGMTNCNGIAIGRDSGSRITSITYAPGKTVTYQYDSRNLLAAMTDWMGGQAQFIRDAAGRVIKVSRSNGTATMTTYDGNGLPVGITHSTPASAVSLALTRDAAGQVTSAARQVPLTNAPPFGTNLFAVDAASQIGAFRYDALGRLTNDGAASYQWDLASRLKSVTQGGQTVAFGYDAFGQMVSQTNGGVARGYVWNYAFQLPSVAIVRQGGADLWYNVIAPDGSLVYTIRASDGARRWYHFDESGNTLCLTDDSGAITDSYALTPYGVLAASSGSTDNPYVFAGQFGVSRIGVGDIYYARARFYDGQSQKFLSRDSRLNLDPIELDPYGYAAGDPVSFADLTGRDPTVVNGQDQSVAEPIAQGVSGALNTAGGVGQILSTSGETTIALAHIANGMDIETVVDAQAAFNVLTRQLPKVEKARALGGKLKAAGAVGTAVGVATAGVEIYQQYNADQQTLQDQQSEQDRIIQTYSVATTDILKLFREKKIDEIKRNNLLLQAKFNMEDALFNIEDTTEIDIILHAEVALKNALGAFVPVPTSIGPLAPENALKH